MKKTSNIARKLIWVGAALLGIGFLGLSFLPLPAPTTIVKKTLPDSMFAR